MSETTITLEDQLIERDYALHADIVPQQVAVSTLLEKYRQQHPELVHVQPPPQVHQQMNGKKDPVYSSLQVKHQLALGSCTDRPLQASRHNLLSMLCYIGVVA